MPVLAAVAIGGAVIGAIGGAKSASASRAAAREQAALTYEQRTEEIRRMKISQASNLGRATAFAAASGVERQGTPDIYLKFMEKEQGRQIDFAERSAKLEREAIRHGAPGVGASNMAAAASLLQGVSSAIGAMG